MPFKSIEHLYFTKKLTTCKIFDFFCIYRDNGEVSYTGYVR